MCFVGSSYEKLFEFHANVESENEAITEQQNKAVLPSQVHHYLGTESPSFPYCHEIPSIDKFTWR